MKCIAGTVAFASAQRRNTAVTYLQNESSARGLVSFSMSIDGDVVSGVVSLTIGGQAGLKFSFRGEDSAVDRAGEELYRWMDSTGQAVHVTFGVGDLVWP